MNEFGHTKLSLALCPVVFPEIYELGFQAGAAAVSYSLRNFWLSLPAETQQRLYWLLRKEFDNA